MPALDAYWRGSAQIRASVACYAARMNTPEGSSATRAPPQGGEVASISQECSDERCEVLNIDQTRPRVDTDPTGWVSENLSALRSSNDFVERNGLPLAQYRYL